jgi:hypothetical protein
MSIRRTDRGVEFTPGTLTFISVLITVLSLVFSLGARWQGATEAVDRERRERIAADSSQAVVLLEIRRDVRAIKAKVLGCQRDPLCQ